MVNFKLPDNIIYEETFELSGHGDPEDYPLFIAICEQERIEWEAFSSRLVFLWCLSVCRGSRFLDQYNSLSGTV
jgi:hypothetical protein